MRHASLTSQHRNGPKMRSSPREGSEHSNDSSMRALAKCKKMGSCTTANTAKHKEFLRATQGSIGDMQVSNLPGISPAECKRLCEHGYRSVLSLLEKFLEFNMDQFCFINWLMSVMYMRRLDASQCYCALLQWHQQNPAQELPEDEEEITTSDHQHPDNRRRQQNATDEFSGVRRREGNQRHSHEPAKKSAALNQDNIHDASPAARPAASYHHNTHGASPAADVFRWNRRNIHVESAERELDEWKQRNTANPTSPAGATAPWQGPCLSSICEGICAKYSRRSSRDGSTAPEANHTSGRDGHRNYVSGNMSREYVDLGRKGVTRKRSGPDLYRRSSREDVTSSRSREDVTHNGSAKFVRKINKRNKPKTSKKAPSPVQLSAAEAISMIRKTVSLVAIPAVAMQTPPNGKKNKKDS
ncbi:hypothetical protein LSAT2_013789 [Lamellibrachia satsuma]|nr:hypothetical protein LSAT2_013789 [Lamellibrachia satsuma]